MEKTGFQTGLSKWDGIMVHCLKQLCEDLGIHLGKEIEAVFQ